MENWNIREAERRDCVAIVGLLRELALFEKMLDQVKLTAQDLERDGFDSNPPHFKCLVAEVRQETQSDLQRGEQSTMEVFNSDFLVIGYALYFHKYSTWEGKGIHLEDFYVTPKYRYGGIGTKLLRAVAKIAVDGGYARLTLECLGWNKSAIDFYKRLDAIDLTEEQDWHTFRFVKSVLPKLAGYDSNKDTQV